MKKNEKKAPISNRAAKKERDRRIAMGTVRGSVSSTKKKTVLCIIIAGIALFCGLSIGMLNNLHISGPIGTNIITVLGLNRPAPMQSDATPVVVEPATAAPTAPVAPKPADSTPDVPSSTNPAVPSEATEKAVDGAVQLSAASTKEEIVEFFNTAANKVKTEAVKVVRNYEDLTPQNEYLIAPGALQPIAEFAMNKFLTKDETPMEFATPEDIKSRYPVENEDYASKVTTDLIDSATVEDKGDSLLITLNFIDDEANINPAHGTGYGTAFNILVEEQITLDYPGLSISNVKLHYHNGVIKCTVDKATGHITESTYIMPMILSLTPKILLSELDAQIGMCFEHNYSISY